MSKTTKWLGLFALTVAAGVSVGGFTLARAASQNALKEEVAKMMDTIAQEKKNCVLEKGEAYTLSLTVPEDITASWKVYDAADNMFAAGVEKENALSVSFQRENYGLVTLALTFEMLGNAQTEYIVVEYADVTAPTLSGYLTKTVQTGNYDFAADLSTLSVTDNAATTVLPVVTEIKKEGVTLLVGEEISEYIFKEVGEYAVTVSAKDANGNAATQEYIYTVQDTVAPAIVADAQKSVYLDEEGNAALPAISVTEAGAYTLTYAVTKDGTSVPVDENGKLTAPALGEYSVKYTVTDSAGLSAEHTMTVTVAKGATLTNDLGVIYAGETVRLPLPNYYGNASVKYYLVEGEAETEIPREYAFAQAGEYVLRAKVTEDITYGGGKTAVSNDVKVTVVPRGTIDFEEYNGGSLGGTAQMNGATARYAKILDGEGADGSAALKYYAVNGGDRSTEFVFDKAIPLPEGYEAIRFHMSMNEDTESSPISITVKDGNGNTASTEERELTKESSYHILALDDTALTSIVSLTLSNTGQRRNVCIDDISFVKMPDMLVDGSAFEGEGGLFAQNETLKLPQATLLNYVGDEAVTIGYAVNGGAMTVCAGDTLSLNALGKYEVVYTINADGARLEKKFTFEVVGNEPAIYYENTLGTLYEGDRVELPQAKGWQLDGELVTEWKLNDGEYTEGAAIESAAAGNYTVRYSSGNVEETFTFIVAESDNVYGFEAINGGYDGMVTPNGNGDYGAYATVENGILTFGGTWWCGVDFDKPLVCEGADSIFVRIRANKTLSDTAFIYHDVDTNGWNGTEGVVAYAITTEWQILKIEMDAGETGIKDFLVLIRGGSAEVDIDWIIVAKDMEGTSDGGHVNVDVSEQSAALSDYATDYTEAYVTAPNGVETAVEGDTYTFAKDVYGTYKFRFVYDGNGKYGEQIVTVTATETLPEIQVVIPDSWGYLYEGSNIELPKANVFNFEGTPECAYAYRLVGATDWTAAETATLNGLSAGDYEYRVQVTSSLGESAEKTYAFRVREKGVLDFDTIEGKTNGELKSKQGTVSVDTENGYAVFTGSWWAHADLITEVAIPEGATHFTIRVKAYTQNNLTALDGVYVILLDTDGKTLYRYVDGDNMVVSTSEWTEFTYALNSTGNGKLGTIQICNCDDGSGNWRKVYVDEISFSVDETSGSTTPTVATTGIFGGENQFSVVQGTVTSEADGSLKLTGAWWVKVTFDDVTVPAGATKMIVRMKANRAYDDVLYNYSYPGGSLGSDDETGLSLTTEYVDYELSLNTNNCSLTEFNLCVQDDGSGGWKMIYIESITFV